MDSMMHVNLTPDLCGHGSFGPVVEDPCPRGTDLKMLFQEMVLSLGPGLLLMVILFTRMIGAKSVHWWPRREVTTWKYWVKQGVYISHLIVSGLLVILRNRAQTMATSSHPCVQTSISFTADLTSTTAASLLILNTALDTATTTWSTYPRPITSYLFIGLISDVLRARTLSYACTTNQVLGPAYLLLGSLKFLGIIFEVSRPPGNLSTCTEDNSGVLARLVFAWLYSTVRKGCRTRLQIRDLPATKDSVRIRNHYGIQDPICAVEKANPPTLCSKSPYALHGKIFKSFSSSIAVPISLRLLLLITSLAQPMIIQAILKFTESPEAHHGVVLVLGVALIYIAVALLSGAYWQAVNSDVARLRGFLFASIYKRALLFEKSKDDSGNGAMISLLSSDVDAVLQGFLWLHEIWATLITAAVSMWMLHAEVGLAFLSPAVCTLVVTAISSFLSKHLKHLQQTWLRSTAERSEFTLYVMRNMFGIKMSGMSRAISEMTLDYRRQEVEKSKKFRKMTSLLTALANASTLVTTLATLSTFAMISRYTGEELNATKMFTALAILQLPMSSLQILISAVPLMGATMASIQRIQEYLASPSASSIALISTDVSGTLALERSFTGKKSESRPLFNIEDGTIGWTNSTPLLRSVSLKVLQSEICFILGQAGSGKSSLLDIIAGRAEAIQSVTSTTKEFTHAAYCEQTPWLPNDTIQNVIVGPEKLDKAWFARVLSLCCLAMDIACLQKGSDTLVGADGAGLSGGQKKRIALARAIYSRNRILILDDPLGSLDATTERALSNSFLGPEGYFRSANATVILTASTAKYLEHADRVFEIQGDEVVEKFAIDCLATLKRDDQQCSNSLEEESGSHEVDLGPRRNFTHGQSTEDGNGPGPKASLEEHKIYVSSIGKRNFIIFLILSALIAVSSLARSLEMKRISEYYSHDSYNHLEVYIGLVAGTLILIFWWNWHFYIHGVGTSSIQLHKIQWDALIDSPMRFFITTEQGEIMNSFTQDLRLVDKELPTAFSSSVFAIFLMMVNVLIAVMASKFTALAIPFLGVLFWLVCRTYLRVSYQVRLLELQSVSPIFNHAIETMQGHRTIHSFGWAEHFYAKFLTILDNSQRPYYTMRAVQQALQVVLDLFVAVMAITTCWAAVTLKHSVDTGMLGLTLTTLLTLGGSSKLFVRSFTDLETSMGAIRRINTFVSMAESEHAHDGCRYRRYDDARTSESLENWPADGSVIFENVTASYGLGQAPVLRNINLNINHGQRVAICGRSGSGKTSLLSSLFDMVNITSGTILISDLPTSEICVQKLRENIAGLPQDTFFLPGSVRDNFRVYYNRGKHMKSPYADHAADEDHLTKSMVDSLVVVGLYHKIVEARGLDYSGIDFTTFLSPGERQLFNLARLSITSSPIVVMDEVMSSLDEKTETIGRSFIREKFQGKTIIGIVHRLDRLVAEDWDSYVLLHAGRVAETGELREAGRKEKFIQLTGGSTKT